MTRAGPEARKTHKLFGRRKGPKLSVHQQHLLETLLPELTLALEAGRDPRSYFSATVDDVWLEIGFGAGEHLLWQAEHQPNIGIIGAEPYVSGVAKLLSKIAGSPSGASHHLPQVGEERQVAEERDEAVQSFSSPTWGRWRAERDGGGILIPNIGIYSNDARDILDALPDHSLGRVFILFPDPWPKTRHHKRRFIQMETLDALARVTKYGAELRFASDDTAYANWTLERFIAHPAFSWTATCARDWQSRPNDWPQTRYESKALHGVPMFLRFIRR